MKNAASLVGATALAILCYLLLGTSRIGATNGPEHVGVPLAHRTEIQQTACLLTNPEFSQSYRANAPAAPATTEPAQPPSPGDLKELDPRAGLSGCIRIAEGGIPADLADRLRVRVYQVVDGGVVAPPQMTVDRSHFVEDVQSAGRYYFTTPSLPLGLKRVELFPLGFCVDVEVTRLGGFADLVVPELAFTTILLRDSTGAPAEVPGLRVVGAGQSSIPFASLTTKPLANGAGVRVISAPGRLSLSTGSDQWYPVRMEAHVVPGANTLEFEVQRACRFEVSVELKGQSARFPSSWWMDLELEALDAGLRCFAKLVSFRPGIESSRAAFLVSAPGAYRVTLPPVEAGASPTLHEVYLVESRGSVFHLDPRATHPTRIETR